ncbi:MAG: hypothetical protein ACKVS6_01825 [Planctomycetota bacterium]
MTAPRKLITAFLLIFILAGHAIAQSIPMPDVYGLSSAEAITKITEAGFTQPVLAADSSTAAALPAGGRSNDFVEWQSEAPGVATDAGAVIRIKAALMRPVPDVETGNTPGTAANVSEAALRAWRAGRFRLGVPDPADPSHLIPLDLSTGIVGTVKLNSQKPAKATKIEVGGVIGIILDPASSGGDDTAKTLILLAAGVVAGAIAGYVARKPEK